MSLLRRSRRAAYRYGSIAGDGEAVASGSPSKMVKRLVRKRTTRGVMGILARIFR
jgi:hypothetical protein